MIKLFLPLLQLTENEPKDVPNSKLDLSFGKSCYKYSSLKNYDDCVSDKLSKKIGNMFNCSLPFLQPSEKFEECKLDLMATEQRIVVFQAYKGLILTTLNTLVHM